MIPATFLVPSRSASPVGARGCPPSRRRRGRGSGPSADGRLPVRAGRARPGLAPSQGAHPGNFWARSEVLWLRGGSHVNGLCTDGQVLRAVWSPPRSDRRQMPLPRTTSRHSHKVPHGSRASSPSPPWHGRRDGGSPGPTAQKVRAGQPANRRIKRRQESERCPEVVRDGGNAVRLTGQPSPGVDQGHPSTLRSDIRHDRSTRVTARRGITGHPGDAARSGGIARLGDTTWRRYKVEFGGTTRPASRREGGNTCRRPS
jgi:hypothetical protein